MTSQKPVSEAARAAFERGLISLYDELSTELDALAPPPLCQQSGNCCDFRIAEHVLFATSGEIERARTLLQAEPDVNPHVHDDARLCVFWSAGDRACKVRDVRPLGCRIYYCDPTYLGVHDQAVYERYHRRIADLHEAHAIPYAYRPFVRALRAVASGEAAS